MTNNQKLQNDLLTELKNIATAVQNGTLELTNWRSERTRGEVDRSRAPLLLDYLVLCELMGRGDPTKPRTFEARRTPAVPPTSSKAASSLKPLKLSHLTLEQLPSGGAQVAIFVRPDSPAEVVEFLPPDPKDQRIDFSLSEVKDDEPIVRLELRRADGYPIALGPRLGAV